MLGTCLSILFFRICLEEEKTFEDKKGTEQTSSGKLE